MEDAPLEKVTIVLDRYVRHEHGSAIPISALREFVSVAYFTSMKSEEGRPILCTLEFLDPSNPGGNDPPRVRPQRHTYLPFRKLVPLTVRNLVKLAPAAPPWAACVGVLWKGGLLYMSGLLDQEIHVRNSLNREQGHEFKRSGFCKLEITGVGAFSIYDENRLIASVSQGSVITKFYRVFDDGPLLSKLIKLLKIKYPSKDARQTFRELKAEGIDVEQSFRSAWTRILSRILLNIRRSSHGGAVLITDTPDEDVSIKHSILYDKLQTVIGDRTIYDEHRFLTYEQIFGLSDFDTMPYALHISHAVAGSGRDDAIAGETGCVHFVGSLARIDGCIVIGTGPRVLGFGAELTAKTDPSGSYSARDVHATVKKLRPFDFKQFGTRHRSMIRYCHAHPNSVGFVVSQDGDVRAITKIKNRVIVWENIQLQDIETVNVNALPGKKPAFRKTKHHRKGN